MTTRSTPASAKASRPRAVEEFEISQVGCRFHDTVGQHGPAVRGQHRPVDADTFARGDEMRRGVEADFQPMRAGDARQEGGGGAFAVGADDLHGHERGCEQPQRVQRVRIRSRPKSM